MKAIREEHAGRPAGPLQVRISATGRAEIRPKEVTAEEANAGLESKLQLWCAPRARRRRRQITCAEADAEGEWERWCHLPCGATGRAPPLAEGVPIRLQPADGAPPIGLLPPAACALGHTACRLGDWLPVRFYQLDGEFDPSSPTPRRGEWIKGWARVVADGQTYLVVDGPPRAVRERRRRRERGIARGRPTRRHARAHGSFSRARRPRAGAPQAPARGRELNGAYVPVGEDDSSSYSARRGRVARRAARRAATRRTSVRDDARRRRARRDRPRRPLAPPRPDQPGAPAARPRRAAALARRRRDDGDGGGRRRLAGAPLGGRCAAA